MENFEDSYAVDPRPEQLDVTLKLLASYENWEKIQRSK
jgi:hypothetical protein